MTRDDTRIDNDENGDDGDDGALGAHPRISGRACADPSLWRRRAPTWSIGICSSRPHRHPPASSVRRWHATAAMLTEIGRVGHVVAGKKTLPSVPPHRTSVGSLT